MLIDTPCWCRSTPNLESFPRYSEGGSLSSREIGSFSEVSEEVKAAVPDENTTLVTHLPLQATFPLADFLKMAPKVKKLGVFLRKINGPSNPSNHSRALPLEILGRQIAGTSQA